METATYAFTVSALIVGVLGIFGGLLFVAAWLVHKAMRWLKVWHVYMLAVSIRLHGRDYADLQFWEAIAEKASKGKFHADMIAKFATEHAPPEDNAP